MTTTVAMLVGPIQYRAMMQADDIPDTLIDRLLDSLGTWHNAKKAAGR